jgi:single-stranded DNA-specific DHH superfamily exonuclease
MYLGFCRDKSLFFCREEMTHFAGCEKMDGFGNMEQFHDALKNSVKRIEKYNSRDLILLHHNDSDGLTSGAILLKSFLRGGYRVNRLSLEKPYPEVLLKLFNENRGKLIVFADFAGRIAPLIGSFNRGNNLVLILDHHRAEPSTHGSVINLDPDLFGLKGDWDISASVLCYHFAKELHVKNNDLVHIAAFGGIADFYCFDKQVHGLNKLCVEEAIGAGSLRSAVQNGEEEFFIRLGDVEKKVTDLYRAIDVAGGAGFYSGGPELGISILLNGITDKKMKALEKLQRLKTVLFEKETRRLKRTGLKSTGDIQWFDVADRFSPMGVKMIGIFCEEIVEMDFVDKNKYIAGFQHIPDYIPGFGPIEMGQTKVSMRASRSLSENILNKSKPGMDEFFPAAALSLEGFADACHRIAAAVTVKKGKEEALMLASQKILE